MNSHDKMRQARQHRESIRSQEKNTSELRKSNRLATQELGESKKANEIAEEALSEAKQANKIAGEALSKAEDANKLAQGANTRQSLSMLVNIICAVISAGLVSTALHFWFPRQ